MNTHHQPPELNSTSLEIVLESADLHTLTNPIDNRAECICKKIKKFYRGFYSLSLFLPKEGKELYKLIKAH